MIKFTIVTITYNAAQVLSRTLESVIAQDYPCVEHIVVDGASTDDTLNIAYEYKDRSDKSGSGHVVRIQSEPDKGLYDAMNKGLRLATGDYICYINAGDCLHSPDTLSLVASKAMPFVNEDDKKCLPAVIYGDTDWTDNNGNYIGKRRLSPPEHLTWRSFKHGMLVCHQAFYARVDIARNIEYNLEYRHSSDVDWCIRVMKEAEKRQLPLVNVNQTVADYQREGQTTKYHRASLIERFNVMRCHYGLIVTLSMHVWFLLRAVLKRARS
ncbi:MAG: glycosyltransferase family 2 protein [Prevotellaceae bacterium]|nr:glycosyltransferase family 2 protein [Prevotellaceae bacterium]